MSQEVVNDVPLCTAPLPPALRKLLRAQTVAKRRRLVRAFADRRRLPFSVLAVVLACIWLGNVIMSVIFRRPTPPETFAYLVPVSLLLYGLWHLVKTAFCRPPDEIEWTSAERELLCAGPFRRYQLITYRLLVIFNATLTKATVFTVLMLPDLHHPLAGFVGIMLGLALLDLIRLAIEIAAHGTSRRNYLTYRTAVIALLAGFIVSTLTIAFCSPRQWTDGSSQLTLAIIKHLGSAAGQLLQTPVGIGLLAPFQLFAVLMTTDPLTLAWLARLGVSIGLVVTCTWLVLWLDAYYQIAVAARERADYPALLRDTRDAEQQPATQSAAIRSTRIPWWHGVGPVAWRQLVGARKQQGTLLVAMGLPGLLAILPVWVSHNGSQAALNVAAAVTFYSFLLLPTAFKFDFRRDLQQMVLLKMLPIRSSHLVLGQIAAPALLSLGLQTTVMLVTMVIKPYAVWKLLAILALLAQLNFLIFAVDNLIFILYPYRLNQEGLEIFLRTTLTFTAKGLVFAGGLVAALLWSYAVVWISRQIPGAPLVANGIFILGGSVMLTLSTCIALRFLAAAYDRFDPSQDLV